MNSAKNRSLYVIFLLILSFCLHFCTSKNLIRLDKTRNVKPASATLPGIIKYPHSDAYLKGYIFNGYLVVDGTPEQAIREAANRGAELVILSDYKDYKEKRIVTGVLDYEAFGERILVFQSMNTFETVLIKKVDMFVKSDDPMKALNTGYYNTFKDWFSSIETFKRPSYYLIKSYIDKGVDVDFHPGGGKTLFYKLFFFVADQYLTEDYQRNDLLRIGEMMLKSGADVNIKPPGTTRDDRYIENGVEVKEYLPPLQLVRLIMKKRADMEKIYRDKYIGKYGDKLDLSEFNKKERENKMKELGIPYFEYKIIESYIHQAEANWEFLRKFEQMLIDEGAK